MEFKSIFSDESEDRHILILDGSETIVLANALKASREKCISTEEEKRGFIEGRMALKAIDIAESGRLEPLVVTWEGRECTGYFSWLAEVLKDYYLNPDGAPQRAYPVDDISLHGTVPESWVAERLIQGFERQNAEM